MTKPIDTRFLCPASELRGDDDEDTAMLRDMFVEASSFLTSHYWCTGILESFFGMGIGKVVAVFLFCIAHERPDVDSWLWVVTGDLPPAYLVCDDAPDAGSALQRYVEEMRRWVDAVRAGHPLDDVIPVRAEATFEHADMLASRLDFLEGEIIPHAHQNGTAVENE